MFTDIEGSTARWERNPLAMREALRRHDAIVRGEVECRHGFVFKTVGDAFCVAFERADDAVRAAVAVQKTLAQTDFSDVGGVRVRIAVHTGTAHERDGDYFGPTVNRVARLLATGHGGQILLSGVTAQLVCDQLPRGTHLADLGTHTLKDLERPEDIHQVDVEGFERSFPALRSLMTLANNLPTTLSSFVGRERELAHLALLLAANRVVTIVGSGGVGKTRTATQVAAAQLERFSGGVWLIEFAPISDPMLLPNTIATTLHIDLAPDGDPVRSLIANLKGKPLLLVFDNCEHLIDAVASVAAAIVKECPDVSLLLTSRQTLGISGEHAYRMPSLVFPSLSASATMTARTAIEFEAVRLFTERAHALDAGFELTDANAPIIAEICRRLDGIPLAIELAAARVRVLAPAQLRDRLDTRLRLLTSVGREAPPRQQTLRALIDWSYDFLDVRERTFFSRLGVFVDGFTLEAATAVCAENEDEFEALDLLASLVDKSLVVAEVERRPTRYRLLESMRAYAVLKLDESGTRARIDALHLAFFATLAEKCEQEFARTLSDASLAPLAPELDNIRAALGSAFAGHDAQKGATLLCASRESWRRWKGSLEGIERCERAVATNAFDPATMAQLLCVAAFLAYRMIRMREALAFADRATVAARASGSGTVLFDALLLRALALMFADRTDEAEADLRAAGSITNREESVLATIRLEDARGVVSAWRKDYARTIEAFTKLAQLYRAHGSLEGEVRSSANLAEAEHALGKTERAIEVVRGMLPFAQSVSSYWEGVLQANLAGYLASCSDLAGARAAALCAIELSTAEQESPMVVNALDHFALTLALEGDCERAARLIGYSDATRLVHHFRRQHTEFTSYDRLIALLQRRYPAHELEQLLAEGARLVASAVVKMALSTDDEA